MPGVDDFLGLTTPLLDQSRARIRGLLNGSETPIGGPGVVQEGATGYLPAGAVAPGVPVQPGPSPVPSPVSQGMAPGAVQDYLPEPVAPVVAPPAERLTPVSFQPTTAPVGATPGPIPGPNDRRAGEPVDSYLERLRVQGLGDVQAGWESGWKGLGQLAGGIGAVAGQSTGIQGLQDAGVNLYRQKERELQPYQEGRTTTLEQIDGVGSAVDWAQYQLGNLAPSMAISIGSAILGSVAGSAVPGAGTVLGAGAGFLAKGTTQKFLAERVAQALVTPEVAAIASTAGTAAAKTAADAIAKRALAQQVGAGAGLFASSYLMGVGDIAGETMDAQGQVDIASSLVGALPYAALDAVTDLAVLNKVLRGSDGQKALSRYARAMLTSANLEGAGEAGQEAILMLAGAANGKEYDGATVLSRLGNSYAAAALGGSVLGVGGGRKAPVSEEQRDEQTLSGLALAGLAGRADLGGQPTADVAAVLADPTADLSLRARAVAQVGQALRADFPDLADLWDDRAAAALETGRAIPVPAVLDDPRAEETQAPGWDEPPAWVTDPEAENVGGLGPMAGPGGQGQPSETPEARLRRIEAEEQALTDEARREFAADPTGDRAGELQWRLTQVRAERDALRQAVGGREGGRAEPNAGASTLDPAQALRESAMKHEAEAYFRIWKLEQQESLTPRNQKQLSKAQQSVKDDPAYAAVLQALEERQPADPAEVVAILAEIHGGAAPRGAPTEEPIQSIGETNPEGGIPDASTTTQTESQPAAANAPGGAAEVITETPAEPGTPPTSGVNQPGAHPDGEEGQGRRQEGLLGQGQPVRPTGRPAAGPAPEPKTYTEQPIEPLVVRTEPNARGEVTTTRIYPATDWSGGIRQEVTVNGDGEQVLRKSMMIPDEEWALIRRAHEPSAAVGDGTVAGDSVPVETAPEQSAGGESPKGLPDRWRINPEAGLSTAAEPDGYVLPKPPKARPTVGLEQAGFPRAEAGLATAATIDEPYRVPVPAAVTKPETAVRPLLAPTVGDREPVQAGSLFQAGDGLYRVLGVRQNKQGQWEVHQELVANRGKAPEGSVERPWVEAGKKKPLTRPVGRFVTATKHEVLLPDGGRWTAQGLVTEGALAPDSSTATADENQGPVTKALTPEAESLLSTLDHGAALPLTITRNLRKIAKANDIEVTPEMQASGAPGAAAVIEALRGKRRAETEGNRDQTPNLLQNPADSTNTISDALKNIAAGYDREAEDWASRVYKKNRTQVELVGDGPSNQESLSIGSINERRRAKRVAFLRNAAAAVRKLAKRSEGDILKFYTKAWTRNQGVEPYKTQHGQMTKEDMLDLDINDELGLNGYSGDDTPGGAIRIAMEPYRQAAVAKAEQDKVVADKLLEAAQTPMTDEEYNAFVDILTGKMEDRGLTPDPVDKVPAAEMPEPGVTANEPAPPQTKELVYQDKARLAHALRDQLYADAKTRAALTGETVRPKQGDDELVRALLGDALSDVRAQALADGNTKLQAAADAALAHDADGKALREWLARRLPEDVRARAQEEEGRMEDVAKARAQAESDLFAGVMAWPAVANTALSGVRAGVVDRENLRIAIERAVKEWHAQAMEDAVRDQDGARARALDGLVTAKGLDTEVFTDAVLEAWVDEAVKRAVKADRAARREAHAQTIAAALASAWEKSGFAQPGHEDDPAQGMLRGFYLRGWNHALEGGTGSNLPVGESRGETSMARQGYEAAVAWLGSEDGKAFATGKRAQKMTGVGETLKRRADARRARLAELDPAKAEAPDAFVQAIFAETERASVFEVPTLEERPGLTPGARRWLMDLRNQVLPFGEWMAANGYGGRGKWMRPPIEQVTVSAKKGADERAIILKYAQYYVDQVGTLAALFEDAKTVQEASEALADWVFAAGAKRDQFVYSGVVAVPYASQSDALRQFVRRSLGSAIGDGYSTAGLVRKEDYFKITRFLPGSRVTSDYQKTEQDPDSTTRAQPLTRPRFDRVEREGEEYRQGRDISADELARTFGLRGVTYGQGVTAKQRQDHTNYAYDAFMDLARFLGIEPAAIGLGGRLAFAFGALGHGKFAAHYTPDNNGQGQAINLTNTRGDGSVAHEWLHALDYNLRANPTAPAGSRGAGQEGPIKAMVTLLRYTVPSPEAIEKRLDQFLSGQSTWTRMGRGATAVDHARMYLQRTIRDLDNVVNRGVSGDKWAGAGTTAYAKEADSLGEDYWGNPTELFARAGESWVFDEMTGANSYLVSDWVEDGKVTAPSYRGRPYPTGDERTFFNDAFRKLFEQIEWTAKGPRAKGKTVFKAPIAGLLEYDWPAGASRARETREEAQAFADKWNAGHPDQPATVAEVTQDVPWQSPLVAKAEETMARARALLDDAALQARQRELEAQAAAAKQAAKQAQDEAAERARQAEQERLRAEWEALQAQHQPAPEPVTVPETKAAEDDLSDLEAIWDEVESEKREEEQEAARAPEPQAETGEPPDPRDSTGPEFVDDPNAKVVELARRLAARDWTAELTWRELGRIADEVFGGTKAEGKYDPKDAYDALEMALNLIYRDHPKARGAARAVTGAQGGLDDAKRGIGALAELDNQAPTQTNRTAEQDEFQQFSTPHTHSALMARVAGIGADDVVLEPSAGTGNLATMARIAGAREVVTNELAPRRAAILRALGFDVVTSENAEQLANIMKPRGLRPTVVLMNPPFSATGGRLAGARDNQVGAQHVEQALRLLAKGGRAVILMGKGYTRGHRRLAKHWDWLLKNYNVRANIGLSGDEYRKFGTTFDNRLVVIDNTGPTANPDAILGGEGLTVAQALEALEGVRNERVHVGQRFGSESGGQAVAEPGQVAGPGGQSGAATGPVGAGAAGPDGGLGAVSGGDESVAPGAGTAGATGGRGGRGPRAGGRRGARGGAATAGPGADAGGRGGDAGGATVQPGAAADTGLTEPGAGAILAQAVKAGVEGVDEALTGLFTLFGGSNTLRSFPGGIDEETYAKAKPHFEAAAAKFLEAGHNFKAFFRFLLDNFGAGIKPYALRFAGEWRKAHPEPPADDAGKPMPLPDAPPQEQARAPNLPIEPEPEAPGKRELSDSIYDTYQPDPAWAALGAHPHPTQLVESAAMAAVRAPALTARPDFPREVYTEGRLSAAQLDAVAYAEQAHAQLLPSGERKGFFIGDGTGVGKGREISGILFSNWRAGRRKAVWVSVNNDLEVDSRAYLNAVAGSDLGLFNVGKVKADGAIEAKEGVAFMSYSMLRAEGRGKADETGAKTTAGQRRLDQLVAWLGADFDGVIAFDESHNLGNAQAQKGERGTSKPSQQALAGLELQTRLPKARVVYVSATGATEVANLAYTTRLGLWGAGTPFADTKAFVAQVASGGVAAMEVVAKDLKALGVYTARSLPFSEVSYDQLEHALTADQREMYDTIARAWQVVLGNIEGALDDTHQNQNGAAKGGAMAQFWGAQQRFFNQMLTALQMPSLVAAVEADLKAGRAPVLQFVNTNEAAQERGVAKLRAEERDLEELDITPRQVLLQYLQNSFPVAQFEEYTDDDGTVKSRPVVDQQGNPVLNAEAVARRDGLMDQVAQIRFPDNPLDILVSHFGSDQVAEITGRKRRFVRGADGKMVEEKRNDALREKEVSEFQGDKRRLLIFSDKGGTGKSYHADRTERNQRKRVHYVVQPGWRADKAIQGLGRTHRTNQASAPHVVLVTTDLRGHRRFVASIARRMNQLGALTKGHRKTGGQGLFTEDMNLESVQANEALSNVFGDVLAGKVEGVDPSVLRDKMGIDLQNSQGGRRASAAPTIQQFLNRILVLEYGEQNRLFEAFAERHQQAIEAARSAGTLDAGLETIRASRIEKKSEEVVFTDSKTGAETRLVDLDLTNPVKLQTFEDVMERSLRRKDPVFFARNKRSGRVYAFTKGPQLTRPNTGAVYDTYQRLQPAANIYRIDETDEIGYPQSPGNWRNAEAQKKWEYLDLSAAREAWADEYARTPTETTTTVHLLTGVLLPIWDRLSDAGTVTVKRAMTDDGEVVLGRELRSSDLDRVLKRLTGSNRAAKLTPAEVFQLVLNQGRTVVLANNWRLMARMLSGNLRIELIGVKDYADGKLLQQQGVLFERVGGYDPRYFIPTDPQRGPEVLAEVMLNRPAIEVVGEAEDAPVVAVPRFSIADTSRVHGNTQPAGVPLAAVQRVVDHARSGWLGKTAERLPIRVVQTQDEALGAASVDRYGRVKGLIRDGEVWLIAEHLESVRDAQRVLAHEVVGHYGLDLLGDQARAEFLKLIQEAAKSNRFLRSLWAQERARNPILSEAGIAEEVFAKAIESGRSTLGQAWDRLMVWLRDQLRALGVLAGNRLSPVEVRLFAQDIARAIRAGAAEKSLTVGERFMFAGKAAKTADTHALATAQERLAAGDDKETVRQQTGWFQGGDQRWRFEIDDSQAQLTIGANDLIWQKGGARLEEVLEHPALFSAYPSLADVRVRPSGGMTGGSYQESTQTIRAPAIQGSAGRLPGNELLSTLLHEVQHGVQYREGFAKGGNPEGIMVADFNTRLQIMDDADVLEMLNEGKSPKYIQNALTILGRVAPNMDRIRRIQGLSDQQKQMLLNSARAARAYGSGGKYEVYNRLAGEVEARNTQARRGMSVDERRVSAPGATQDIADNDVIVVWNGQEMASAPRPENAVEFVENPRPSKRPRFVTGSPFETEVFHGSRGDIASLDKNFLGSSTKANSAKEGFFFTSLEKVARFYSKLALNRNEMSKLPDGTFDDFGNVNDREEEFNAFNRLQSALKENKEYNEASKRLRNAIAAPANTSRQKSKAKKDIESAKNDIQNIRNSLIKEDDTIKSIAKDWEEKKKTNEEIRKSAFSGDVVYRFRIRMNNPLVIDFNGASTSERGFTSIIQEAKKNGNDGVVFLNARDPRLLDNIFVVFESEQATMVNAPRPENAEELSSNPLQLPETIASDAEYLAAVQRGDMAEAQHMVDQAAERAGAILLRDGNAYTVYRGPEPRKTFTAYKKFSTVEGRPQALFVGGADDLPVGVWLDGIDPYHFTDAKGNERVPTVQARKIRNGRMERAKMGEGTKIPNEVVRQELIARGYLPLGSKAATVATVAYRPGWHMAEYPLFAQGGRQLDGRFYENINNANDVYYQVEVDDTNSAVWDRKAQASPSKDLKEMPIDGAYRYYTNPRKDVKIGDWFIGGRIKIMRPLSESEVNAILDANGIPRQGWDAGLTEAQLADLDLDVLGVDPAATQAYAKLPDAVTYDDNGKIIPLSQRFDRTKPDPRFSLTDDADAGGSPLGGGRSLRRSIREALSDKWTQAMPATLRALTLGQLIEVGEPALPGMAAYGTEEKAMEAFRNDMMEEAGGFAEGVFAPYVFGGKERSLWSYLRPKVSEQGKALFDLIHAATLANEDPSVEHEVLSFQMSLGPDHPTQTIEVTEASLAAIQAKKERWMKDAENRNRVPYAMLAERQIRELLPAERERLKVRPALVRQWEALSQGRVYDNDGAGWATEAEAYRAKGPIDQSERRPTLVVKQGDRWVVQAFGGQEVYRMARDLYKKRDQQRFEAIIANLEESGVLDEETKREEILRMRAEFESSVTRQGKIKVKPYFPLFRQGDYFVAGRRFKDNAQEAAEFFADDREGLFPSAQAAMKAAATRPALAGYQLRAVGVAGVEKTLKSGRTRMDYLGYKLVEIPEQFFGRYDTPGEARAARAELARQGYVKITSGLIHKTARDIEGVTEGFVAEAIAKMRAKGEEESADILHQMYLAQLQDLSQRMHFIHRKKTPGFEANALQAFGHTLFHLAHQIAKLKHAPRLARQLRELEDGLRKSDAGDKQRAGHFLNELKKRHEWVMNPLNSAVTNTLGAVNFFWYLGLSPAAALVNLTQTPMVALPVIAARFNDLGGVSREMLKALRDVKAGMGRTEILGFLKGEPHPALPGGLSDLETKAFHDWTLSGARDVTRARNLAGIGDSDRWQASPAMARGMAIVSSGFHMAEVVNRDVTLLTAYRMAIRSGVGHAAAVTMADKLTVDAHLDYSNANRAGFMQGNVAKVLTTFRAYSQGMTYLLGRAVFQAVAGESKEVQREARQRLAGVMGMTALFGGTAALPLGAVFLVLNLAAAALGDEDEPWDAEVEFRNWLAATFPRDVADILDRGAVTKVTGLDWGSRVGMDNLWWRAPDKDLEGEAMYQYVVEQILGPTGALAMAPFTATKQLADGQWQRAAETLMPKFVRDWAKTARYVDEGVLTTKGAEILPGGLNAYEAVWQALGMRSDRLDVRQDANAAIKLYEGRIEDRRSRLMAAYAMALIHHDAAALPVLMEKIQAFNRAQPGWPITPRSIRTSVANRERGKAEAEHGMSINQRLKDQVKEAGAFAP